jgi:hypothetical protein
MWGAGDRAARTTRLGAAAFAAVLVVAMLGDEASATTLAYWRFENDLTATTGGSLLDLTNAVGATDDFTTTNLPVTMFPNAAAYVFNGADDELATSAVNLLNGVTAYTVEFFFNPATLSPGFDTVVSKPGVDNTDLSLFIELRDPAKVLVSIQNSTSSSLTPTTVDNAYAANTWQHFALVFDGSQPTNATRATFFIDGNVVAKQVDGTVVTSISDILSVITLGNLPGDGRFYDGLLDEVRISDAALAPSEFLLNTAIPEPTAAGLLLVGLISILFRWASQAPWASMLPSRLLG